MEEMYTSYKAICDLRTRAVQPTIPLPAMLTPAPHMEIIDIQKFTSTALTRLESDSALLRGIAERSLRAVINSLKA